MNAFIANQDLSSIGFWEDAWKKHIETYLKAPPRTGYFIASLFPDRSQKILEIASGSSRDSLYLSSLGYNVTAVDFDLKTMYYLRKRLGLSLSMLCADAFHLPFKRKSFDISFSNGFWILFRRDEEIHHLIREQSVVTKKYLISLVHNSENKQLVKLFEDKAKKDPLYNIRFFHRKELTDIIKDSGISYKSIQIKKFGGITDVFLRNRVMNMPNLFQTFGKIIVPRLYELHPWSAVERIACIVKLE
ncbi:MAG: class I SAM-dependent methyltransferase [Methanothrix sp.]